MKRKVVLLDIDPSLAGRATGRASPPAKRPRQAVPATQPAVAAWDDAGEEEGDDEKDMLVGASERFEETLRMFDVGGRAKEREAVYGLKYNYGDHYVAAEQEHFSAAALQAAEKKRFKLPSPTRMEEWEGAELDRMLSGVVDSTRRRNDPTRAATLVATPTDKSLHAASLAQQRGAADCAASLLTPDHLFVHGGRAWQGTDDPTTTGGLQTASIYTPTARTWRRVRIEPVAPPPRYGHSVTARPGVAEGHRVCYLFGGAHCGKLHSDLWEVSFDGTCLPATGSRADVDTSSRRLEVRCTARSVPVRTPPCQGPEGGRAYHTACLSPYCGGGREAAVRAGSGPYLWVFGGVTNRVGSCSNALFCFDMARGTWRRPVIVGDLPSPRAAHSAVLDEEGECMYVYGGVSQLTLETSGEVEVPLTGKLGDVFKIDLRSMVATEILTVAAGIPPLPRCHHTAHVFGRVMHVVGGDAATAAGGAPRELELVRLDLEKQEWTACAAVAKIEFLTRHASVMVAAGAQPTIYAFGGTGRAAGVARIPLTLRLKDLCAMHLLTLRVPYAGPHGSLMRPPPPPAPAQKRPSVRRRRRGAAPPGPGA